MKIVLSQRLVQKVLSRFSELGDLTSRSMFGGYGICLNKMMFALVSDGKFYLRGNKKLKHHFAAYNMEPFVYRNRSAPVVMHYYLVNDELWRSEQILFRLIDMSLSGALNDKKNSELKSEQRLKDLPNLSMSIERLLMKANIHNKQQLIDVGALNGYLRLLDICDEISIDVLFFLAGAIEGYHVAALPKQRRSDLLNELENHLRLQPKGRINA